MCEQQQWKLVAWQLVSAGLRVTADPTACVVWRLDRGHVMLFVPCSYCVQTEGMWRPSQASSASMGTPAQQLRYFLRVQFRAAPPFMLLSLLLSTLCVFVCVLLLCRVCSPCSCCTMVLLWCCCMLLRASSYPACTTQCGWAECWRQSWQGWGCQKGEGVALLLLVLPAE